MVPEPAEPAGSTRSAGRPASSVGVHRTSAGTGNCAIIAAKPCRICSIGSGTKPCGSFRSIASNSRRCALVIDVSQEVIAICMLGK